MSFVLSAADSRKVTRRKLAKPIKLIVYMKPAGLIDVMARRFVAVAARHAPDATFVVENKHGAGGIVAMRKVQRQKADGYTLFACTKSNVSKAVSCDVESYLTNFHWLAYLMADSECVITHRESDVSTWSQLAADAIAKPNEQLWLGPENGGLDHVTALKIWEAAGMTAKWIPCSSGAEARGKLLGQQGVAYVGNPRETLGHPNLTIAAVCSHQRLPQFPDAPTFRELGIDGLENENMWRGIAIKKGAPIHAIAWYEDLFQRVSADPEWRSFWEKGGIHVQFQPHDQFSKIVEQDRQSFRRHLTEIGLVRESTGTTSWMFSPWLAVAVMITTVMGTIMVGRRAPAGVPIVGGLVLGIAITLLCHTFAFPASSSVGPAVIPRLYVAAVGLVVVLLMCERHKTASEDPAQDSGNTPFGAAEFIFSMIAYWFAVVFFGYAIATALFLGVTLFRLGVRRPFTIVSVAVCWIAASYVVFVKVLYVPLPTGFLWESF
ncbi:tripartite tricarboxylate transporter substrate-binding protein [Planctomycetota bacterium]